MHKGLNTDSFILRHKLKEHREMEEEQLPRVAFEIIKYHRTAMERQIFESLMIRKSMKNKRNTTLNNKLEYNRCVLPDITEENPTEEELRKEEE